MCSRCWALVAGSTARSTVKAIPALPVNRPATVADSIGSQDCFHAPASAFGASQARSWAISPCWSITAPRRGRFPRTAESRRSRAVAAPRAGALPQAFGGGRDGGEVEAEDDAGRVEEGVDGLAAGDRQLVDALAGDVVGWPALRAAGDEAQDPVREDELVAHAAGADRDSADRFRVALAGPDDPGGGHREEPLEIAALAVLVPADEEVGERTLVAAQPLRRTLHRGEHPVDELARRRVRQVEAGGDVGGGARVEHRRGLEQLAGALEPGLEGEAAADQQHDGAAAAQTAAEEGRRSAPSVRR